MCACVFNVVRAPVLSVPRSELILCVYVKPLVFFRDMTRKIRNLSILQCTLLSSSSPSSTPISFSTAAFFFFFYSVFCLSLRLI